MACFSSLRRSSPPSSIKVCLRGRIRITYSHVPPRPPCARALLPHNPCRPCLSNVLQVVARLQKEVEDLVLEIFERLPQTVDGFQGGDLVPEGMKACCIVFAPEKTGDFLYQHFHGEEGNRVKMGPLKISLQARHQLETFCTQPLVLDFMSRKFTCGFPGLWDSEGELRDSAEFQSYRAQTWSSDDVPGEQQLQQSHQPRNDNLTDVLAGGHAAFGSVTLVPGAQFIMSQLVMRPNFCYTVPAVRMTMDLLVYLGMLVLFGSQVLLYDDAVGVGEGVFFTYVLVRCETSSAQHSRSSPFLLLNSNPEP